MRGSIYGAYMRRNSEAERARRRAKKKVGAAPAVCPFTLEAVKDCLTRKHRRRGACRFSLEDCLSSRS